MFFLQRWTEVKVSGPRPLVRNSHAACCIAGPLTGQQYPVLMVIGGWYTDTSALDDVWLLDVDKGVWSEVSILRFYSLYLHICITSLSEIFR